MHETSRIKHGVGHHSQVPLCISAAQDRLFVATYRHVSDGRPCGECACDGELVPRTRLEQGDGQPAVHFGLIASGDMVEVGLRTATCA